MKGKWNHLRPILEALIVVVVFLAAMHSEAKVVYYGSEIETVTVAYGGATLFRFDDEVKTISRASRFVIQPADSANPNYSVLAVTPRFTRGKDKVTFILANGVVVSTQISVVPKVVPEKTDTFYDFQPKERMISGQKDDGKGVNVSELDLMKAMIRGDNVVGYDKRVLVRTVNSGIKSISAKLVRIYTGPKYNGYVFKVENLNYRKNFAIDVKSLTLGHPNVALLSQIDNNILSAKKEGKNQTYLRIVAKPTSVYYNIFLPVAPILTK